MKLSLILVTILAASATTASPTQLASVPHIPGAAAWTPPDRYREIHESAQECTGRTRDYDLIQWMVVPGQSFYDPRHREAGALIGLWVKPDTIYLSAGWKNVDWVPKHEMIHDLLQRDHWPGDTAVWGSACHAMWGYLDTSDPVSPPGTTTNYSEMK